MGAAVDVFDLKISEVALAALTDRVSWPSSTRKQHVMAVGSRDKIQEDTMGTLTSRLAMQN